ncbi:MAG: hypothetical protein ACJ8AO_05515 [Gemmatimonadaceae bacterium]
MRFPLPSLATLRRRWEQGVAVAAFVGTAATTVAAVAKVISPEKALPVIAVTGMISAFVRRLHDVDAALDAIERDAPAVAAEEAP